MWFVAKCNSRPSWEGVESLVITPALLLPERSNSIISFPPLNEISGAISAEVQFFISHENGEGQIQRLEHSAANLLTDAIQLRSSSSTLTLAPGILVATMASLAASPAEKLRTAMMMCTPRSAMTRAVSSPMPLDAPAP